MFICDEVRAPASPAAAAARLAALARGSSLAQVSHAAWDSGITAQPSPELAVLRLVRVQCRGPGHPGPVQADAWGGGRGGKKALIVRWEAAAGNAVPFAALDADITLIPDGDHAVLLGLAGVYRTPPGTRPDQLAVRTAAAVTTRALLIGISDAISNLGTGVCTGDSEDRTNR